jgi:hypothetical protein
MFTNKVSPDDLFICVVLPTANIKVLQQKAPLQQRGFFAQNTTNCYWANFSSG